MNAKDFLPLADVLSKLDGPLTFARFLAGERTRAGLTQEAAGKKLGISRQMVCDIEKDRQPVSVELAAKIAKKLQVSATVAIEACLQDQLRRAHVNLTVTVEAPKKRAGVAGEWRASSMRRLFSMPGLLSAEQRLRYERHLRLPEVGEAGQLALLRSRVLLVGVGGLGSPAALYLAAAGVGTLGLVDGDRVDASNLQRQILHAKSRIDQPKVHSAEQVLRDLNPDVTIDARFERLTAANADRLLHGYDVVLDGSDNIETRYLLNDACMRRRVPLVHGAIYRFEGQVSTFVAGGPCYRCLYPEPPPPEALPSCADAGVLGVLPGTIGTLQATEALKLLLGQGEPLVGRLLRYDSLAMRFTTLAISRNPRCPIDHG